MMFLSQPFYTEGKSFSGTYISGLILTVQEHKISLIPPGMYCYLSERPNLDSKRILLFSKLVLIPDSLIHNVRR